MLLKQREFIREFRLHIAGKSRQYSSITMEHKRKPLYSQVLQKVEADILQGVYSVGRTLPSDIELSQLYGVSVATARRAYAELVQRGWVSRKRKRGTVLCRGAGQAKLSRIGLILVADVPPYQLLRQGVELAFADQGTAIETRWNHDSPAANEEAIKRSIADGAEGLIVTPPIQSSFETLRHLVAEGFPLVMALNHDSKIHSVYPDDHHAGYLIGEHFAECGYRRVAAVMRDSLIGRERLYGFREAIARHGMELSASSIVPISYEDDTGRLLPDLGRREAEQLLSLSPRPEAVFVYNDSHASAVYHWLQNYGVEVPREIAIAGVDKLGPGYHPFSLTTVDTGLVSIGLRAGQLLLSQLQSRNLLVVQEKVTPQLHVGKSTCRIVAAKSLPSGKGELGSGKLSAVGAGAPT
jgi:DNA-binding LacI/PurR family transcriptional regulator